MIINKYANHHANDTNRVINSNVNKSGQNITAGFVRGTKKPAAPQTQRIGSSHGTSDRSTTGRNIAKQSIIATQTQMTASSMLSTHQVSIKGSNSVNKVLGGKVTDDKENKQRLSNKQPLQSSGESS